MPDQERSQLALNEDLRSLLREHEALRGDVERLLQEKQRLLEEKSKSGNGNGQPSKDDQKSDEKKQGDDKGDKEEQQQPKPPLKDRATSWVRAHPIGCVLIILGVVALGIATYLLLAYLQSYVSTDDAEIDGHTNQIGSRIAGTVTAVYTEDNRSVEKGQVLVDLDPTDYQAALAQAEARLSQAAAELDAQSPNLPITVTTEATNVISAHLDVTNAQAALAASQQRYQSATDELRQAEANSENAAREEVRYRNLVDKQEVSREAYDQRATAARAQQSLVASRRAAADAAQEEVKQREAAVGQVNERDREVESNQPRQIAVQHATVATRRAGLAAAKAQVVQARLNLSYCKIAAPVAGIIGNKTVEVGQQVAPGQELFAITPTDDLWVTANFKETQVNHMQPGQRVTVHVDALDLDLEGVVENMPGATGAKYSLLPPENATGNYVKVVQRLPVRIRFRPNQPGQERLRPGMSVEPKVWLK